VILEAAKMALKWSFLSYFNPQKEANSSKSPGKAGNLAEFNPFSGVKWSIH